MKTTVNSLVNSLLKEWEINENLDLNDVRKFFGVISDNARDIKRELEDGGMTDSKIDTLIKKAVSTIENELENIKKFL